jgi:alpha-methylacyl-CoA racemase
MMLADLGAEVIRIDRPGGNPASMVAHDITFRNRRSVALNLKHPQGAEVVLRLCEKADAIFEGFRPGVAERLGVGPAQCLARNPKIVYGRMTGWGQNGPMANAAGHDINYIALSGALHAMGRRGEAPAIPLNLIGDLGGGGMVLAYGMVCALRSAQKTGKGPVVDAAMVDGAALLMAMFYDMYAKGLHKDERGVNMLDSGAHFYDVYETRDKQYVSIGSIEPQFYALLKEKMGLGDVDFGVQMDPALWPAQKEKLAAVFRTKTRDEWCAIMEGTDVCFAPVLGLAEAPNHPHNKARGTFYKADGMNQPAPAPRFSGTPTGTPKPIQPVGVDTLAVLSEAGFSAADVQTLSAQGAVACL